MGKVAIFYGPEGGSVHRVANKIKNAIGEDKVVMVKVKEAKASDIEKFDQIIFGISTVGKDTWNSEFSNNDWGVFFPEVSKVSYSGKKVAIFGLGDHITYSKAFVDHMGLLGKELIKNGAELSGKVPADVYEYEESEAVVGNEFLGLPVDEDFEPEMTDERIANWIDTIRKDFDF